MYDLNPKAVYAHERVFENPQAVARMERMLDALGVSLSSVPRVSMADLDEIIETAGAIESVAAPETVKAGHGRVRQGILKLGHDPVIVFNTFVWDPEQRLTVDRKFANPHAQRLAKLFAGVGADFAYSRRELFHGLSPGGYVCQGGWGIHTIAGCVHKCDYCGQGFITNIMLDLEDFADQLAVMFEERPEQKLYRYDLFSDVLCFEPEYGASEVVGRAFDQTEDKYLLLYTRSNNVDYLFDLPYRTHTLINWTLSMDTVCRAIERDTPSLAGRIEAMRKCQAEGYVVRAGFSPIIPVADWRQETTEMFELLFREVEPEVLRAWVIAMMDADEFERMFDCAIMDQDYMERMRSEAHNMNGKHAAPFPLDVRTEIYAHYIEESRRISPETPLAICTEEPEIWDLLEDRIPMTRNHMFCCCGGTSVPGSYVPQ